jgi:phosphocarrier protein FPr
MIGLVVVSHSARLADGACELAAQVAQGRVRLASAGGTSDPENPFGTDAFRVVEAIESVYTEDGVLLFMDLGSAVLSAETALELLSEDKRPRVRLCRAPLVEGVVAAATLAAAGAGIEEILRETDDGRPPAASDLPPAHERLVTLANPLGLHARPAARFVRLARGFQARVTVQNVTRGNEAAGAASINALLGLGARRGDQLRLRAEGPGADEALAQLAAFLASGFGETAGPAPVERAQPQAERAQPQAGRLSGIPASEGIAIGPLFHLHPAAVVWKPRSVEDPPVEIERLRAAIRGAGDETASLLTWARAHAGEDEAGIFDAQALFLEDPDLLAAASEAILKDHIDAASAWQAETEKLASRLRALDDPYLRARAVDVADAASRVLRRLTDPAAPPASLVEPSIVAAADLTPSEVKQLDPRFALGLCLESGSASAHSIILARALGIPAVVGLGPPLSSLADDVVVAIDGEAGLLWVAPDPGELRQIEDRRRRWLDSRRAAQDVRHRPAATRDGRRIRVVANISGVEEAAEAVNCGAEGVGVLRTEFLFLGRATAPSEEEQLEAYRTIAALLGGRPLVIRTLDAGGDKDLPYIVTGAEVNPFLGWRGIRLTLGLPDLFRTQIRAILRAAAEHPVNLLLPMVSTLDEVRQAKALVTEAAAQLERERIAFGRNVRVGVMIEVPAAVAVADQLARESAFFSIGTNDLIQYAMAADRTNARVAALADPFQPAVLRLIRQTVEAARQAGIEAALCGELAADPLATPLLLGLGLDEFSVSVRLIPALKRSIARWTLPEAVDIARQALALDTSAAVRQLLRKAAQEPSGTPYP